MTIDPRPTRDEILVLRFQLGELSAFEELTKRWESRLLYYLRRLVPQEADAWDALQRTWLAAYRGLKRMKEPKALRAWLYRVARNQAANHCRDEFSHRTRIDEEVDPDTLIDPPWEPELEQAERVHLSLGSLSLPHREVLTLHFLEQMPLDEIASITQTPVGTVKSRLHYAKRLLKEILKTTEHEHE